MNISDWMRDAQDAPYFLGLSAQDSMPVRWIVSLSNGLTIYDLPNRDDLEIPSAWMRLKKFCEDKRLAITQLRLQKHGQLITLESHAKGYFFAKYAKVLLHPFIGFNEFAYGIGFINQNDDLQIYWLKENGSVSLEVRDIKNPHPKHKTPSLIKN